MQYKKCEISLLYGELLSHASFKKAMGYTPLHVAAARNYFTCVQVLLNMKGEIDVNATTPKGYTPMYLAVACKAVCMSSSNTSQ